MVGAERTRLRAEDGRVNHVELVLDDAVVFLGKPHPEYHSPKRHAEECEAAARWLESPYVVDGVYVRVDDVDEHRRRAEAAGATMLGPTEDAPHGDRLYRVADLEGHRWMFAQHVGQGADR